MAVCLFTVTTSCAVGSKKRLARRGQIIFGGHPTVLPTTVIAWKTRFLTETLT
jgi:hypothetical protein